MSVERPSKHVASPFGKLPEGWRVVRLNEIVAKLNSGATPNGGESNYLPARERFALIRSQNVFDRRFDDTGLAFISDEQAADLAGAEVQAGDVLLNITGDGITFARSALVPERVLPACVNQHVMLIRTSREKCEPGFLLAYLTHPRIKDYIESFNAGGSRRAITKRHIESFEIPLAPLSEQRAIANALITLDDKIELNRQMNKTLEAIAQALFKSWFVDFDPVRVLSGQMPEKPPFLYVKALRNAGFPDRFEDSELGEIPKNWCPGTLGEVAENPRRVVVPNKLKPSTPYIGLEHMPRCSVALGEWDCADEVESNKFAFKGGEILFGKFRPYFHKVGIAPLDGVCSTDVVVIRPRVGDWLGFVLGHVSSVNFVNYTNAGSTGTKMPRTNWQDMARYEVALPPQLLAVAFNEKVGPLVERMIANIHESRTLAALRDALLPKLLSGELRLKETGEICRSRQMNGGAM
jgi:type I restriction enzyme S subunit